MKILRNEVRADKDETSTDDTGDAPAGDVKVVAEEKPKSAGTVDGGPTP